MAYRDPQAFEFEESHREEFGDREWRFPQRLVTGAADGADGSVWASLWRQQATRRGGGSASSLLPVLAVHTWPGKRHDDLTAFCEAARKPVPIAARARDGWTSWAYLSHRRMASLAGIDKDTVAVALRFLKARGHVQTIKAPRARGEPASRMCYRVSAELYRTGEEPFVPLSGMLFYGGQWSMLPTAAARHLYVTLACLDPIHNPHALAGSMYEAEDADEEDVDERIVAIRERHRLSLADLKRLSGIPAESTVATARDLLTTPIYFPEGRSKPGLAMFRRESQSEKLPTWYEWTFAVREVHWPPHMLNDPDKRKQAQRSTWAPHFAAIDAAKRRATARKAAQRRKQRQTEQRRPLILAG
jgi:hypothetical protein